MDRSDGIAPASLCRRRAAGLAQASGLQRRCGSCFRAPIPGFRDGFIYAAVDFSDHKQTPQKLRGRHCLPGAGMARTPGTGDGGGTVRPTRPDPPDGATRHGHPGGRRHHSTGSFPCQARSARTEPSSFLCGHCDFRRVQRDRPPLLRPARSRHRVVRTQDPGKDPPLDARSVTAGNRAGRHHRIHPLPAALAAPGGRDAAPWPGGPAEGSATTAGSGASGNGLGARHTAQANCRLSTRRPGSPVSLRHGGLGPVEILSAPLIGPGGTMQPEPFRAGPNPVAQPLWPFSPDRTPPGCWSRDPSAWKTFQGCLRWPWR